MLGGGNDAGGVADIVDYLDLAAIDGFAISGPLHLGVSSWILALKDHPISGFASNVGELASDNWGID